MKPVRLGGAVTETAASVILGDALLPQFSKIG